MKPNRLVRVNSLLKEVLFEVIHREVKNPEINEFVTVTRVETSADLQHAKVYISLIASDAHKQRILQLLQESAGYIAVHASKKVRLRYFPQLLFKLDTGLEHSLKIQQLLSDLERERNSREEPNA